MWKNTLKCVKNIFPQFVPSIVKKIDHAIAADDSEETLYVCDGCKEEIK